VSEKRKKPTAHEIAIGKIIVDRDLQPRASIDLDAVREYAEAMKDGAEFPPVVVFFDGLNYWLADGFHRHAAALKAEMRSIRALVYQGDKQDALLFSLGANAEHGLRRTHADKRRAVIKMLNHPEWCMWSDAVIARYARVSPSTVSRYRANSPGLMGHDIDARVTEGGSIRHNRPNGDGAPLVDEPAPKYELPPTILSKSDLVETYRRRIERHVKSVVPSARAGVPSDFGTIDVVTDSHIYTFATAVDRNQAYTAIGRAMLMLLCLGHPGRAFVVGHFPRTIRDVIARARELRVDFVPPEEVLEWRGSETA
jgi:hypothetical protein